MYAYTKIVFIADQNNKLNGYLCFLFAKSGKLNLKVTNMGHSVYFKYFLSPPAPTTKMNIKTPRGKISGLHPYNAAGILNYWGNSRVITAPPPQWL